MLICSFCLFFLFFFLFVFVLFCFVLLFVCLFLFCFICQTASIFYSHAFQILLPEIFFPHLRSNEGKSSYATTSTIFAEKNRNYFSRTLPTAKIKIREK